MIDALDSETLASLNPGIRELVGFLRSYQFDTCDSGDGKAHDHGCDRSHPYVGIHTKPSTLAADADSLLRLLAENGIAIDPIGPDPAAPSIQATYDPADGIAVIDLIGVDDEMLRRGRAAVGKS